MMGRCVDLKGWVFGRLTVLARSNPAGGRAFWDCLCECGGEAVVSGTNLRRGKTKSCGCLRKTHMQNVSKTHGFSQAPWYGSFTNMHSRCYNVKHNRYKNYGGRGIVVAPRWHNIALFAEDMAPSWFHGASIERLDVHGDYTPANCVWLPREEQALNRTNTVVSPEAAALARQLYTSQTLTQAQVAAVLGLKRDTIKNYLRKSPHEKL